MALTKEEQQELDLLKQAIKVTPDVAKGVLRSRSLPKDVEKKTLSEIKGVLETVGNKVSGTGFLAGLANKGAGDFIQGVTGSTAAAQKAVEISNNDILGKTLVGGQPLSDKYQVINAGNTYYLKDKQSGDYYLFNGVSNDRPIETAVIQFAELAGSVTGGIAGAAMTGLGTVGTLGAAAPSIAGGIAVGTSLGGASGAMAAQGVRESIENKYKNTPVSSGLNIAGEGARAIAEDTGLGAAFQVTGKALSTGAKYGGALVKLIPGTSKLAKQLDTIAAPISAAIGKRAAPISAELEKFGKKIGERASKVSSSITDGEWVKEIGKNPIVTGFNDHVSKLEGTSFGSFLLGVDKKSIDAAIDVDDMTSVNPKLHSTNNMINALTKKLNSLKEMLPGQKAAVESARTTSEKAGNVFFDKFTQLKNEKVNNALNAYNKYVTVEMQKQGLPNPVAIKNITSAQDSIDRQYAVVNKQIDDSIIGLKQQAKTAGVDLGDELIQKDILNAQTKFSQDSSNITNEAARRLEINKTAQQSLEQIQSSHGKQLQTLESSIDQSLNTNPAKTGGELRDALAARWNKQVEQERGLYNEATRMAKGEGAINIDLSDFFTNSAAKLSDVFTPSEVGQLAKNFPMKVSNPEELLRFKQFLDSNLAGGLHNSRYNGAQYSVLAGLRDDLVNAPDGVFSRASQQSPAIRQYKEASADKIARNDFLQAREYAALIGADANFKTGKEARGLNYALDTYDNFIDIMKRDPAVANRTMEYLTSLKGDTVKYLPGQTGETFVGTMIGDLKKGYVNSVWKGTGRDAAATLDQLDPNMISGFGNQLDHVDTISKTFGDLEELNNLKSVKLPSSPTEIQGYAENLADIKQTSALNRATKARDNTVYRMERQKQQQALKRGNLDTGSKVASLEGTKEAISLGRKSDDILSLIQNADEFSSTLGNVEKGLPASQAASKIQQESPQKLDKLLGELGYTGEADKQAFLQTINAPGEAQNILKKTEEGISGLEGRLSRAQEQRAKEIFNLGLKDAGIGGLGGVGIAANSAKNDEGKPDYGKMALYGALGSIGGAIARPVFGAADNAVQGGFSNIGKALETQSAPPVESRLINELGQGLSRVTGQTPSPNARQGDVETQLLNDATFANDPNMIPGLTEEQKQKLRGRVSINIGDLLGVF
jgi:hypothetical protein